MGVLTPTLTAHPTGALVKTVTLPALDNDTAKALSIIGKTVTINGTRQGRAIHIEGHDWALSVGDDGSVTYVRDAVTLPALEEPQVLFRWVQEDGTTNHGWTALSEVRRGVCVRK
jgi:hypothetical protein